MSSQTLSDFVKIQPLVTYFAFDYLMIVKNRKTIQQVLAFLKKGHFKH